MTKYYVPDGARVCTYAKPCVYRDGACVCDQPKINKGNGDAACHRMRAKDLLTFLTEIWKQNARSEKR